MNTPGSSHGAGGCAGGSPTLSGDPPRSLLSRLWPFVTKKAHGAAIGYVVDKLDAEHKSATNRLELSHAAQIQEIETKWKAVRDAGERLIAEQVRTRYVRTPDTYRVQVDVSQMECYSFGSDPRSREWFAESIGQRIAREFQVARFVSPPEYGRPAPFVSPYDPGYPKFPPPGVHEGAG